MKPANYQVDASQFIFERDSSMLFARMGTGKTLTYLMAMQDWIETKAAKRILVVAPLRVATHVWRQECDKWNIPLTMDLVTGEMTAKQKREAVQAPTDVLVCNVEMAGKIVLEGSHGCDAIVFDELSRWRNGTGKRMKEMRRLTAQGFGIKSGGTGTPAPNGLTSLYGMAATIGLNVFGKNYDRWRRRYFWPEDYEQRRWLPFETTPDELSDIIRPWTYVLEDAAVDLPPIVQTPIVVDLPDDLRRQYDDFRKTSVLSDHEIVAGNNGVLRGKLRQMASGFVYSNAGDPVGLDPFRLEAIEELIDEMNGQPVIIAYEFREQLAMMLRRWPTLPWMGGGSTNDEAVIAAWNAGSLPVLAIHPASAGHGLNLQAGGNSVIWWQRPDDLELYDQTIARLRRRGQADDRVFSYELEATQTIDQAVARAAIGKVASQDGLWASLRR
jgi:SNF2 family DNA or RNA helicase